MKEIKQDAAVPGGSCHADRRRNDYLTTVTASFPPSPVVS